MRFVFWDTNFFQTLRGTGLAIFFWDTNFFQTLEGDGACDLTFEIRVSAKILRGTGLAICLLGYEFLPNS